LRFIILCIGPYTHLYMPLEITHRFIIFVALYAIIVTSKKNSVTYGAQGRDAAGRMPLQPHGQLLAAASAELRTVRRARHPASSPRHARLTCVFVGCRADPLHACTSAWAASVDLVRSQLGLVPSSSACAPPRGPPPSASL
jgi:hypothetical protein